MALKIKAYLHFGGQGPEVRYFSIPQEATTNYEYWSTKVRQIFPSLKDKEFKLLWRDNSAEFITFSSDEELKEAIDVFSGDVFKLFITVSDGLDKWCPNRRVAGPCHKGRWHRRFGPGHTGGSMWPFGFWEEWKSSPYWVEGACGGSDKKEEEFDIKKCAQKVKEVIDSAYHAFMSYDPAAEDKANKAKKDEEKNNVDTTQSAAEGEETKDSLTPEAESPKDSSESTADASKSPKDSGFVLVQKEEKETSAKSQPELDDAKAPKDPQQRKLEEALSQMEAMGFHNENGWLAQLIVAKNYDVGRVINTILPQGRPH